MQRQAKKNERAASSELRGASLAVRAFARNSQLATRRGLTLIELLVTIVIMVTVLAGVIPLMSPNNNARKIREASRQLSSMLAQAQAQAARDGRPAGVAFREFESGPGSFNGVALEAFMINEPPPFAGFSDNSQARLLFQNGEVSQVQFVLAGNPDPTAPPDSRYPPDPAPPETIRFGDVVSVGGFKFRISDPDRDGDGSNDTDNGTDEEPAFKMGDFYTAARADFKCTPVGNKPVPRAQIARGGGQPPTGGWANPAAYRILRQPRNTSDAPLQFPRGIGIDMDASGAVGTGPGIPDDFDDLPGVADVVGVMFNPNGTLEGLYVNGERHENASQVFMLMGAVENANNGSQEHLDYNFVDNPIPAGDREAMPQRRSRINWLNADSRWVAVNRAGRIVTATNNISFDPSQLPYTDALNGTSDRDRSLEQKARQLNGGLSGAPGARLYATQMQTEGGR